MVAAAYARLDHLARVRAVALEELLRLTLGGCGHALLAELGEQQRVALSGRRWRDSVRRAPRGARRRWQRHTLVASIWRVEVQQPLRGRCTPPLAEVCMLS